MAYSYKDLTFRNGVWNFKSSQDFYDVACHAPVSNPSRWHEKKTHQSEEYGKHRRASRAEDSMHSKAWSGTDTFAEAEKLSLYGWKEGVLKARPIAEKMSEELIETLSRPQVIYNVEGEQFDMGKVIDDEPECWMQWQQGYDCAEMEESAKGPIKIVLNTTVSAGISQQIIERKGAAAMALAMVFTAAQRPVMVEIVSPIRDANVKEVRVILKDYYDDMNYDTLAFALIHPAFFRRIMFSVWEVMDISDQYGYGTPTDTIKDKGDIYIGQSLYGEPQWQSIETTEAWIRKTLEQQGLKFRK